MDKFDSGILKRFKFWKDVNESLSVQTSLDQSIQSESFTKRCSKEADDILNSCFSVHLIRISPNMEQLHLLCQETCYSNLELCAWFKNIQKLMMYYCYRQGHKRNAKFEYEKLDIDPMHEHHLFNWLKLYIIQYFDSVMDDTRMEDVTNLTRTQINNWISEKIKKVLRFLSREEERRMNHDKRMKK